ncbi:DUF6270 domain-containing protein [Alicyclobacillus sp. SO9]|uniref:DUF6270 domain-containing protein n=1 Tax=Alicyclobacillus sp. SO9 TaxID=2665646 RepID=UPI0018E82475|nr:DUF6270 domain-containing protein [Alicyclobacillus sp. SO9]QQE78716.1 hypothetical protein GI364_23170 [Alicyclobacillus sp. SO9]
MTIDVAVLGSCVSRDLFNSKFVSNYKNFYQCVLTQNQSSIISLMSESTPYVPDAADNLSAYQEWNVRTDFSKEFLQQLKDKQPSYLILDFFADIHFGCLQLGPNQFITDNRWMVQKTSSYKAMVQDMNSGDMNVRRLNLRDNHDEYLALWKQSIDKLFAFLQAEVPHCQIVLHQARNVGEYMNKDGGRQQFETSGRVLKIDVPHYNHLWDTLDRYVIETHPVHCISVFHKDLVSFEDHPWGPFYVHYTLDYYRDSMNELHRIVLDDRLSSERDTFYLSLVSDLGQADKRKTQIIKDKEKKIEACQKNGSESSSETSAESDLPSVPRRVKRIVRHKIIKPLRRVYEHI